MEPTTLYRLYATNGALLYIGVARSWPARMSQHAADKPWWSEVGRTEVQTFPTRDAALRAEREAILAEGPRENIIHNRVHLERNIHPRRLATKFVCDACHRGVVGDEGWITINPPPRWTWDENPYVEWRTYHRACDPDLSTGYWFTIGRFPELVDHVRRKAWAQYTDWEDFVAVHK